MKSTERPKRIQSCCLKIYVFIFFLGFEQPGLARGGGGDVYTQARDFYWGLVRKSENYKKKLILRKSEKSGPPRAFRQILVKNVLQLDFGFLNRIRLQPVIYLCYYVQYTRP